ncbi:multiheme c-type cytochrome [Roseiconus lacunae]|uniref:Multiheme c-type cytochrome n=1 Tax=Roseiconus lacunae TaxID=2605694 RepID=A0ABT7PNK5_9BACT|nr:multiheme c-type cytochrome [Roseiconus lacunae]MDM4018063.1 multiheme c-type cytochrome [Roseiconus lacunae]
MNGAVIGFSIVVGLICGGMVWWVKRSWLAAATIPVAVVGLVVIALPPTEAPVIAIADSAIADSAAESPDNSNSGNSSRDNSPHENLPVTTKLAKFRPIEFSNQGYVASDACLECHPQNHASWYASYHRTMTQVVDPQLALGDFDDVTLSQNGCDFHLSVSDDVCWVDLLDPAAIPGTAESRQTVRRPIVMSTGSHHMQAYWFPIGARRTLAILPFVFLKETQEWIPRSAAFLQPNDLGVSHEIGRWNSSCSRCHSTLPQERKLPDHSWDTQVAEFGISCEACHGPGEDHIAYHKTSSENRSTGSSTVHDPIVNPENLSHVRSSQVCGQCHSVLTLKGDPDQINVVGSTFRPGEDLHQSHEIWQLHSPQMKELLENHTIRERVTATNRGTFYADGVVRVSGREFTSIEQSACFQRGQMSCLSCHQLHKSSEDPRSDESWADDQLKPNCYGNDSCISCHDQQQYSTAHTHHLPESSGSNCYNCHMPHTAYGLLKAIRNHTITSPDLQRELSVDRPNACNQCHLDKTLKWTADNLEKWYSIKPPALDAEHSEIAASILWLLKGNAASRAMAAWTMGWPEAQAVSGDDWQSVYLAQALNDPYLAVRMIARRSLQSLPGLEALNIHPLGGDAERRAAVLSIIRHWDQTSHEAKPALLIDSNNVLKTRRIDAIIEQRDETPMTLTE